MWLGLGAAGGAVAALAIVLVVIPSMTRAGTSAAAPRFVEEASAAGIDHVYDGDFEYFVGGGVAAFDCDDDRRPDLYLAGGANPAALYRNESPIGGALRFAKVSDPVTDLTGVTGAYPLDIDGDGRSTSPSCGSARNVLLRGQGDCRFERANETWGFDGGDAWTVGVQRHVGGLDRAADARVRQLPRPGRPRTEPTCADSELVRPAPGRATVRRNRSALTPGWCTLSILFSDWDRSGRRDLRMTNDRHYYLDGEEQLWRIDRGRAPPPVHARGRVAATA